MRTNVFIVVALCLLGNYSSFGSDLLIFQYTRFYLRIITFKIVLIIDYTIII
jgi:hypothetical protein